MRSILGERTHTRTSMPSRREAANCSPSLAHPIALAPRLAARNSRSPGAVFAGLLVEGHAEPRSRIEERAQDPAEHRAGPADPLAVEASLRHETRSAAGGARHAAREQQDTAQ